MACSTLTDFQQFKLSSGGPFLPSPEINYICIPLAEGVKKRIISALETLILRRGQSFLVQFWAAIETGKTYLLTTTCQPFGSCGINQELESYRIACLDHKLYVHPEKKVAFGLPGRVFLNLIHEETQNVHYYPKDHRPPCKDDIFSKIWGSFAVPVIDANKCVGVLEFITDPPQVSYDTDIHAVHCALKKAGFQSSIQIHHPKVVTASPRPWKCLRRSDSFTKTKYCSLVPYFGLSKVEAAKRLQIDCSSTFRNIRNRVGIPEWPWIPSFKTTKNEIISTAGTTCYEPTIVEDENSNWDIRFSNFFQINDIASDNPNANWMWSLRLPANLVPNSDEDHNQEFSSLFNFESCEQDICCG